MEGWSRRVLVTRTKERRDGWLGGTVDGVSLVVTVWRCVCRGQGGCTDTCERLAVIRHGTLLTRAGRASCIRAAATLYSGGRRLLTQQSQVSPRYCSWAWALRAAGCRDAIPRLGRPPWPPSTQPWAESGRGLGVLGSWVLGVRQLAVAAAVAVAGGDRRCWVFSRASLSGVATVHSGRTAPVTPQVPDNGPVLPRTASLATYSRCAPFTQTWQK